MKHLNLNVADGWYLLPGGRRPLEPALGQNQAVDWYCLINNGQLVSLEPWLNHIKRPPEQTTKPNLSTGPGGEAGYQGRFETTHKIDLYSLLQHAYETDEWISDFTIKL